MPGFVRTRAEGENDHCRQRDAGQYSIEASDPICSGHGAALAARLEYPMRRRHRRLSAWLAGATLACTLMLAADAASAAIWEWGCMGGLGNKQIVFNRNRLIIISG